MKRMASCSTKNLGKRDRDEKVSYKGTSMEMALNFSIKLDSVFHYP